MQLKIIDFRVDQKIWQMKLVSSELVGSSRLFINVLLSRLLFSAQTIYTFYPVNMVITPSGCLHYVLIYLYINGISDPIS